MATGCGLQLILQLEPCPEAAEWATTGAPANDDPDGMTPCSTAGVRL
jgi:hypothetical protein